VPILGGRVPEAGEVYWIDHGIPVGREQGGRRPDIILTPRFYNERSSVVVTCPVTRRRRDWPFQVEISMVGPITGYALVDQLRVVDPHARGARFAGNVSEETLAAIRLSLLSLFALVGQR
jgi:mRNA interferase MazF